MKKQKQTVNLFYVAAALFYLAAVIGFAGGNENQMAVVWMCLGSVFLCFGSNRTQKGDGSGSKKP